MPKNPFRYRVSSRPLTPRLGMRARGAVWGYALLLPSLVGFVWFYAVPFGVSVYYSFVRGVGSSEFVFLDHYKSLFASASFRLALGNTLKFMAVGVPLLVAGAFGLSLAAQRFALRRARYLAPVRAMLVLPMVIPTAGVVLFAQIFFESKGALNGWLYALGLPTYAFLNSGLAFWVLLAVFYWKNVGYVMVVYLAALGEVDPVLYEAAAIDGAGYWRRTFAITLPQILPTVVFSIVLGIIAVFKVYRESYLLAGHYPHDSIYMLQNFMNNNFANQNIQRLTTASTLFMLLMLILIYALLRVNNRERE